MSEENQEPKPIKLKLAGNRRATEEKSEDTSAAKPREDSAGAENPQKAEPEAETQTEKRLKPTLKPRPEREESAATLDNNAPTTTPEAESKSQEISKPRLKPRPEPEENTDALNSDDSETTPEVRESPSQAASIPTTRTPEPEPEKPAAVPPPLPARPTLSADDGLEEALDRVSDSEKSSSSPLLSIVIIVVLLGILGGSGYGLWYILKGSSGGAVDETVAEESNGKGFFGDPIKEAKEAISAIPVEELEEVVTDSANSSSPSSEPTEAAVVTPTNPVATAPLTPQVPNVDQELVRAVSGFLSEVHIGGVRTGERPMVIINGASYSKGDLVEPETGLLFSGIRNGKLAFTDENGVVYLKSF